MYRLTAKEWQHDRRKMEEYIARRLPLDEGMRITLADGPEGDLWAELDVIDWGDSELGLHYETNCKEAVGLEDIYEYFRRQEMTWAEWQRQVQGELARLRVASLAQEVAVLRRAREDIASAAKRAIDIVTECNLPGEEIELDASFYQFQLSGEYWLLRFAGEEGRFPDLEGFRHIAKLLARPEREIESLELQGQQDCPVAHENFTPQFAIDDPTYMEQRIADLEQKMAQAESCGDLVEVLELREELEQLNRYLKGGRLRRLGNPSARERARKAVRNAIDRAKTKVRASMPELGRFLDRTIVASGTTFMYSPCHPYPKWLL